MQKRAMRLAFPVLALNALAGEAVAGSPVPLLIAPPRVGVGAPITPPATGTIVTPTTPVIPPSPMPGRSTITLPGVSRSATPSAMNPGSRRPCGGGANAAGVVHGNAGVFTAPVSNSDPASIPNLPAGSPSPNEKTTVNPSVTPGVPGSC
jgi:hypothetical protein